MAGMFGADFNASQPSDSDLVKRGASVFRDIKTRLKAFLGVCFNLETGQAKPSVFPYTVLKDLNPTPEGTWNEVDVNSKGLVTAGRNVENTHISIPYRWAYGYDHGTSPTHDTIAATPDTDTDGLNVASYSFVVPADVTRIHVRVWGAGGGGGYNATPNTAGGGGAGGYTDTMIDVSEGDTFLVWVGEGGLGMDSVATPGKKGGLTRFKFTDLKYAAAYGGGAGTATEGGAGGLGETTSAFDGWGPNFDFNGQDGNIIDGGIGAGGGGFESISKGGVPVATGAIAGSGGNGLVVVEYWL